MARRYQLLIGLVLVVVALDQWTKLLATEHLTPGVARAVLAARSEPVRLRSHDHVRRVVAEASLPQRLSAFYGEVRHPCRPSTRLCPEVKVFEGFWSWRYAQNEGAAWSVFADLDDAVRLPLLIGVSFLALGVIFAFIRKLDDSQPLLVVALSLVAGGAVGNLIDRVQLGYVIDFILWYYQRAYWPTFNVADVAISTGVGLIALSTVLDLVKSRRALPGESSVAQH